MQTLRKILVCSVLVGFAALFLLLPCNERLPGPKYAMVKQDGALPLALRVLWYDTGLKKKYYHRAIHPDDSGRATMPEYRIRTTVGKLLQKRILTAFDKWTICEHCDGPWVHCSLFLSQEFDPPAGMKFLQSKTEKNNTIFFSVKLAPDESKFATREFQTDDVAALLEEARTLIAQGDNSYVEPANFGSELAQLNPVRVEIRDSSLLAWMGGPVAYQIVPDSDSCPAQNLMWTEGTEHQHIYRLRRIGFDDGE